MTPGEIRSRFLGIEVDALTISALNDIVAGVIQTGEKTIIGHHNLHSTYLFHRHPEMRDFFQQADFVVIDGMMLVALGRLLGADLAPHHRVTYVDWIGPLLRTISLAEGRLFYLGGRAEVVERGARCIQEEYPALEVDWHHGYFDARPGSTDNQAVVDAINAFGPDVLMVGMGMPRQEKWILRHVDQVEANVILPSGACIDYVAGAVPTPPRWMGRAGLEWLYRLIQEPKRLWKRTFVEPWPLLLRFLRELVQRRILELAPRSSD